MRLRDALVAFGEALPSSMDKFDGEPLAKTRGLLDQFAAKHPEAMPFALTLVTKRLKAPWQLIRLATGIASSRDVGDVKATRYAITVSMVLDQLDGLPVLAAAAYNAGPGRARAWRASVPLEGAVYAETIPFNETRDYVKKVLANAMFYQAQLGLPYISLRERLGVVNPRGWNADADTTAAFPLQRTDMAR